MFRADGVTVAAWGHLLHGTFTNSITFYLVYMFYCEFLLLLSNMMILNFLFYLFTP